MASTFFVAPEELLAQAAAGPPPAYSQPAELGCFSFDTARTLTLDRAQLVSAPRGPPG